MLFWRVLRQHTEYVHHAALRAVGHVLGNQVGGNELQRIMDAYPLDTFDIVGHSMGGMTAVYWAAQSSSQIRTS